MSKILVINAGSATLKFKLFSEVSKGKLKEEIIGIFERIGIDGSFLKMEQKGKPELKEVFKAGLKNHAEALEKLIEKLGDQLSEIKFVGHRVVHGGPNFSKPLYLTTKSLAELEKCNKLAPLHNPVAVACIKKSLELMSKAKNYAIFDTAYHQTLPDYAYTYGLPKEISEKYSIRRYGFHGTSHKYASIEGAAKIKKPLKKLKIVTCHLGSGCSMTATKNGEAVGTTMGFTPLEGLMMSTRCGDIDPAVPLFLVENMNLPATEVDKILNKKSGLLGVAGTMDMREILSGAGEKVVGYKVEKKFTAEQKKQCSLALKMFVYNIVRYVGQFTAVMKGLDLIVFTGGVGERSPAVRSLVLKDVKNLGKFKSVVVPADEELMIAREVISL